MRAIRSMRCTAAVTATGILLLHGMGAGLSASAASSASAGSDDGPEVGCSAQLQTKPSDALTLRAVQGAVAIDLPQPSMRCSRVVRVTRADGYVAAVVSVAPEATTITVALSAGVYVAQVKVVDDAGESPWGVDSAAAVVARVPTRGTAVGGLHAERVTGGLGVRWRPGTLGAPTRYRVQVTRGRQNVMSASFAKSVTRVWLPTPARGAYRISVAAMDGTGQVIGTAGITTVEQG